MKHETNQNGRLKGERCWKVVGSCSESESKFRLRLARSTWPGGNFVAEGFANLRDAKGDLLSHNICHLSRDTPRDTTSKKSKKSKKSIWNGLGQLCKLYGLLKHALKHALKPALVYSHPNSGLLEVHKDPLGTAVWFARTVLFKANERHHETSSSRCLHTSFACNMRCVLLQRLRSCKHSLNKFEQFCWSFSQGNVHPVLC